jgi:hypothetical protein
MASQRSVVPISRSDRTVEEGHAARRSSDQPLSKIMGRPLRLSGLCDGRYTARSIARLGVRCGNASSNPVSGHDPDPTARPAAIRTDQYPTVRYSASGEPNREG